ncbi:transposase, partial [Pseudogracilibacillus sp. ICA-222130]|uniref:transposase n=1 Tax=Pseudogracilibacillus sp. ICA-222130 TaxID=3134655 RepID=UPI0030BE904E
MEVEENAVVLRSYQGQMTKFITAKLTFTLNIVDQSLYFRYMKTSIKALKKHLPYIEHRLIYPYNNGRIEGINNKIKVWNRVTYGYRYFHHFKKRIILHFKWRSIIQSKKSSPLRA